jgi:site-specific DNA-methyltransferase (cytosine-N4-specific)
MRLPQFFIRMLTDPGDVVLDIFAGSNTTGWVAESEGRRWLAFEEDRAYVAASAFRFLRKAITEEQIPALYTAIHENHSIDVADYIYSGTLLSSSDARKELKRSESSDDPHGWLFA